jgi:omega-amidase
MQDLRVTIVQSMLHWEDADANRAMCEGLLNEMKDSADLVVLPEMFTTGFTMRTKELGEEMTGPTVAWMKRMAASLNAAIYGSIIVHEGGRHFNRGLFVRPDGRVDQYDKRHLFRMAGEHEHFGAGSRRVVVEHLGWRILLQVCYDLRFPVFSRSRNDHDMIMYVANWPDARRHAWNTLLPARAIENLAYVVGVNRVGMDGKGIHYAGDSVVLDPRGGVVASCTEGREQVVNATLSAAELTSYRERFPAHLDADDFELRM